MMFLSQMREKNQNTCLLLYELVVSCTWTTISMPEYFTKWYILICVVNMTDSNSWANMQVTDWTHFHQQIQLLLCLIGVSNWIPGDLTVFLKPNLFVLQHFFVYVLNMKILIRHYVWLFVHFLYFRVSTKSACTHALCMCPLIINPTKHFGICVMNNSIDRISIFH